MDFSFLSDPSSYVSLLTLTLMEIVLGIDNIIFITILCGKLPKEQEHRARRIGIALALISRLGLLFALSWVMSLKDALFHVQTEFGKGVEVALVKGSVLAAELAPYYKAFSGRDLILIGGGLFLVGKATHEIYENVEHPNGDENELREASTQELAHSEKGASSSRVFTGILIQIIILDIVFSLDSVITAVGMVNNLTIMATAMIVAVIIMLIFSGPVGDFVQRNPSVRILALAFLVLIGVMLLADGMGQHVSKGYVYSAIGFSLLVEFFNLRRQKKARLMAATTGAAVDEDSVVVPNDAT